MIASITRVVSPVLLLRSINYLLNHLSTLKDRDINRWGWWILDLIIDNLNIKRALNARKANCAIKILTASTHRFSNKWKQIVVGGNTVVFLRYGRESPFEINLF